MGIFVEFIRLYQRSLSPDHGWFKAQFPYGYCRFYPTCSAYAIEALEKHHFYGLFLAICRVVRCHPWSRGGVDYVDNSGQTRIN